MKFPEKYTLKQVADITSTQYVGAPDFPVYGINEIHVAGKGDVVFVDHPKYYDKALNSAATVVLINKKVECPEGKALLISDDPFRDFNKLTQFFAPFEQAHKNISPSATIGVNTIIQPNVFIGNNVSIGDNCLIHANVSIYDNCVIGNNVTIQSGAVLGGDAFYFKRRPECYDKLLSGGRVVVEDNVDIGANTAIDKGVTGDTRIGKGTKIDNLVQIAHDTVIGQNCLIASQTGIAGAVIIEDNVTLWGQVGVRSAITITEGTVVLAQAGITKSTKGSQMLNGTPAKEVRTHLKELALLRQLPTLMEKFRKNE